MPSVANENSTPKTPRRRGAILGREVLQKVREDMACTLYPTFLNRAPPDVGSASAGTLTAEQWRTFCMINLVITLVWIWGFLPQCDRRAQFLKNFVDLVAAVRLGTAKRLTPSKINSYEVRMLDYLCGLHLLSHSQLASVYYAFSLFDRLTSVRWRERNAGLPTG